MIRKTEDVITATRHVKGEGKVNAVRIKTVYWFLFIPVYIKIELPKG